MARSALILDDEKDIRDILGLLLEKVGFEICTCEKISEAIEAIKSNNFDLALVDLNLEDGTGFQFIEELNKKKLGCDVVIITAFDSEEERKRAAELDVNHIISKPFNKITIEDKLKTLGYEI